MVYDPYPQQPPTKASLKAWWNSFTFAQRAKKDGERYKALHTDSAQHLVFGKPLKESLRYASVQISTANANGELYVWGYIPVVVAKCGLYLKENATEVEGTFRVNGSNKRMRELQAAFETPPRYGKSLDWKQETYTTHDVASVFRRYLTQMPEPVIPYDMYHHFRDALAKSPLIEEDVIATYKALIRQMPRPNQYLLLYVLDLLSVFARKSDKNLMTATNLAVIFRPGLISHPQHELSPQEHALSQRVLEFLIAQQDWFMLDIPPPPGGEVRLPSAAAIPSSGNESRRDQGQDEGVSSRTRGGYAGIGAGHGTGTEEDIAIVPSSDEEYSQVGGGWKLVTKGKTQTRERDQEKDREKEAERDRIKMMRRRTTMERGDRPMYGVLAEGDMSPVLESPVRSPGSSPSISHSGSAVGVTRSRTLPSSRRGADGDRDREKGHGEKGVLRKLKRGIGETAIKENEGTREKQRERERERT